MNADELVGAILIGGSVLFVVAGVVTVVLFIVLDWLGWLP